MYMWGRPYPTLPYYPTLPLLVGFIRLDPHVGVESGFRAIGGMRVGVTAGVVCVLCGELYGHLNLNGKV